MRTQRLSVGPEAANEQGTAARTLWILTSYGHGVFLGPLALFRM